MSAEAMTNGGAVSGEWATRGRRLRALCKAELTLLIRHRSALFVALALPVMLTLGMRQTVGSMDLSGTGLSVGAVLLPGAIGYVLLFAVYSNLVGLYVARRETLVLKRLRTGEARAPEILAGAALPSVVIGLVQCVVLLVGGAVLLDLGAPAQPLLVVAGIALGMVMMVALAAASAALTPTTETAQISSLPLLLLSLVGSGVVVPLEALPDRLADVCAWLPVSPLMELVRGGWVGGESGTDAIQALSTAVLWTALAVFAVRRSFRWEPRR